MSRRTKIIWAEGRWQVIDRDTNEVLLDTASAQEAQEFKDGIECGPSVVTATAAR